MVASGMGTCKGGHLPVTNREYWWKKFERNIQRDLQSSEALREQGWHVIVVWECELKNLPALESRLRAELP